MEIVVYSLAFPLSPTIPDDKDVAALIQKIADNADFSFEKTIILFYYEPHMRV